MQRPRFFLRRAALIMALLLFALPARALDLSRDELRALFSSLTDAESDALFAETPSIEPPYAAGMLNDEQIDSALGTLNVLRALAGLPEVTGDDELNDIAQHGAVLSAARGEITHAPDALRYFASYRTFAPETKKDEKKAQKLSEKLRLR